MTRIVEPRHDIILGGLNLMIAGKPAPSVDRYRLSVLADQTFGSPVPVTSVLYSMLRNGSIVTRDRDDNREPVLTVQVEAEKNDGNALAKGEAALMAVCHRPVELVWRPPSAGAEPVVFDVVNSNVEFAYDDLDEKMLRRHFRVTMSALPHGRRSVETVVEALAPPPAVPSVVTVDTCDGNTGWTIQDGTKAFATGGYVQTGQVNVVGFSELALTRAGFVDFTPNRFLLVEWQGAAFAGAVGPLTLDGHTKVGEQILGDGWTKTTFRVDDDQTVLTFRAVGYSTSVGSRNLKIRDVKTTDSQPVLGTGRQSFRTLTVGGSVTTQGSIDVAAVDGVTALGDVAIFTYPGAGYQPHLSPWITLPASRTPDPGSVSGARHFINNAGEWIIPAANLPPGEYVLVGRMSDTAGATRPVTYSTRSRMNGVDVGPDVVETVNVPLPAANAWYLVTLGTLNLPATPIGPDGEVRVALVGGAGTTTTLLDELWLFSTAGQLTMLEDVTKPRVSIQAPSLADEAGSLWVGTDADGSDSWGAGQQSTSWQFHDLEPGENNLFVVTTGPVNPAVSARHFDRFHTHPIAPTS